MSDAPDHAARTARELARRTGVDHHDVLVILGTGLAPAAERLGASGPSIPLATLPFFPRYTATGHHAQGCHAYEGIELSDVVHPLRTGIAAGCRTVILTAAVGGIRHDLHTGSIVIVSDHLNLTGRSPLSGPEFVEPQFETPAEIRMMRTLGADVVGMSMAFETIAARHAGAEVLGLAVVTNDAAGTTSEVAAVADPGHIGAAGAAAAPSVAEIIRHVVMSLP
jgi:purine-nucleoside phosphorylase